MAAIPVAVRSVAGGRFRLPLLARSCGQLHGPEREAAWQQIITAAPRFAQYQRKTDRELPIIHLVPRSGP